MINSVIISIESKGVNVTTFREVIIRQQNKGFVDLLC